MADEANVEGLLDNSTVVSDTEDNNKGVDDLLDGGEVRDEEGVEAEGELGVEEGEQEEDDRGEVAEEHRDTGLKNFKGWRMEAKQTWRMRDHKSWRCILIRRRLVPISRSFAIFFLIWILQNRMTAVEMATRM